MVVSLAVGALAACASPKVAGLSTAGLLSAGIAGKTIPPQVGLYAASMQGAAATTWHTVPLAGNIPWNAGLWHAGFVPYYYNHTLYTSSWLFPYQPV